MSQKKMFDWFLTKRGKQFTYLCAGGVTSAAVMGHLLPNTVLVSTYKDLIRLYSKGFSVPVPEKITDRFLRTLDLLEIRGPERLDFRPFMAAGFDVYSIGTLGRFGIHLAIPVNFTYDRVEDIDQYNIKVNLESVIWESDAGKQLLNALVLPENAQMYAMAREVKTRSSFKLFFDTFYAGAACLCTYGFSRYINRQFNLFSKPRSVRIIGYTLVTLLNMGNYAMAKDLTQCYYEKRIDEELRDKSPVLAEGGKVFYTKILERNKALRDLMGKEGQNIYSVLGNENYYIRHKHMSLVHRKQIFEPKQETQEPVELTNEQLPS